MEIRVSADDGIVLRLAALGVKPDDVTIVVNSHLHFDHAGNNRAFPNATFIVQAEHFAYAKGKPSFPAVYWDDPALRYMPVGGRAKVAAGRAILPPAGHRAEPPAPLRHPPRDRRVRAGGGPAFT